jgi:hypothetical protein
VPASPWLDSTKPAPPATVAASSADKIVIARTSDEDARFVTVSILKGSQWELVKLGKPGEAISVPGLVDGMKVRVTVLDRASNESEPRVVTASR